MAGANIRLFRFNALHSRRRDYDAVLFAFDLIEHQGDDLRNAPLLDRKRQQLLGTQARRLLQ